jgi:hypothetical protein
MPMTETDAVIWELRFGKYPIAALIKVVNRGRHPEYDTASIARAEICRRMDADGVPPLADTEAWARFAPTVRE